MTRNAFDKKGTGTLASTGNGSLNDYIEAIVKRYSSLFTLPSHSHLLMLLLGVCLLGGIVAVAAFHPLSASSIVVSLVLGATLFVLIMATDLAIHFTSFKSDLIFNLRRCSALSLYSTVLWLGFILLGTLTNAYARWLWLKLFLLGFCAVLALRLIVLLTVSFAGVVKVAFYALLMPVTFAIPVLFTASLMGEEILVTSVAVFFSSALVVTLCVALLFLYFINSVGVRTIGVNSLSVLRAFLASWTEDLNQPLEQLFERLGLERDVKASALAFRTNEKLKALMIVPAFHPGPFKNVGSSNLPHIINASLERKLPNCTVAVPHGLSGHDLDLASQSQNQLVLNLIENMVDFSGFKPYASKFVRVTKEGATASCQVFNKCALVTLTLAPETMEDLPPDLDTFIVNEAVEHGLSSAICIDAHNSIQGHFNVNAAINPLKEAATECLTKAASLKPESCLVGSAKVMPADFSLSDGMGPDGIAVTVIKVDDSTAAYVTVDGNNMVSGLREKILLALSEVGITDGEVFTTDTHSVNAVVLNARGYHPIGEAMDHNTLIRYVQSATTAALANLQPAETAWRTETVSNVKVVGEKQIGALSAMADQGIKRAKRLALTMFPAAGVILVVLLYLL